MENLIETTTPWESPVEIPVPGEDVKAAPDMSPLGAIRQAFRKVVNRTAALVLGDVTYKRIHADGTGKANTGAGILNGDIVASGRLKALISAIVDQTADALGISTLTSRYLAFTGVSNGADGSNPPLATGLTNELRAVLIPKAWLRITTDGGGGAGLTQDDGINISSASFVVGQSRISVTFSAAMKDTKYAVDVTASKSAGIAALHGWVIPSTRAVNGFTIQLDDDPRATVCEINLFVFGRQNS